MSNNNNTTNDTKRIVCHVLNSTLGDGTILEQLYDPQSKRASFLVMKKDGQRNISENYVDAEGIEYRPSRTKIYRGEV